MKVCGTRECLAKMWVRVVRREGLPVQVTGLSTIASRVTVLIGK